MKTLVVVAAVLSASDDVRGLVVHQTDLDDLVFEAQRIVYGEVLSTRVERRAVDGDLWTVYTIAPLSPDHAGGIGAAKVEVYLPGGTLSGMTRWVPGVPEVPVGTRAWWLLEHRHGVWLPVGYRLGVVRPSTGRGGGLIEGYVHVNSLDGEPIRWAQPCLAWYLDLGGYSGIAREDIEAALRPAFGVWNEVADAYPVWQFGGATCSAEGVGLEPNGARNIIVFRTDASTWPHPQRVVALTSVSVDDTTGFIRDADVEVNAATQVLSVTGALDAFDLRQVATHEVGHMLGLDHSPVADAVMFRTTLVGEQDNYELHPDDADGLRASHPSTALAAPPTCADLEVASWESPWCPKPGDGCASAPTGPGSLGIVWVAMVLWRLRRLVWSSAKSSIT